MFSNGFTYQELHHIGIESKEQRLTDNFKAEIIQKISECKNSYQPFNPLKFRFLLANIQLTYVLLETAQANMREALKSLPSIYRRHTSKSWRGLELVANIRAVWTLSWIFHACQPLAMDELREALIIQVKKKTDTLDEANMEDLLAADILECCQSLVVYEESSVVVQFSHPTVQEFLKSQIRESQIELPAFDLATTCLAYKVFEEGLLWIDSYALRPRLVAKFKFSSIAAEFWSVHSSGQAEDHPDVRMAVSAVGIEGEEGFNA
jgi:hypothetical protein